MHTRFLRSLFFSVSVSLMVAGCATSEFRGLASAADAKARVFEVSRTSVGTAFRQLVSPEPVASEETDKTQSAFQLESGSHTLVASYQGETAVFRLAPETERDYRLEVVPDGSNHRFLVWHLSEDGTPASLAADVMGSPKTARTTSGFARDRSRASNVSPENAAPGSYFPEFKDFDDQNLPAGM
jgi:hypothetical protein